jgi:hypothetical protein
MPVIIFDRIRLKDLANLKTLRHDPHHAGHATAKSKRAATTD